MILSGDCCSSHFPIFRGSRQGSPLSPLLFVLSLEPLAPKVHQSPNIIPTAIKSTIHQISLYADDLLLFISEVSQSLPHIFSLFTEFSRISGYKINWQKSALLPLKGNKENLTQVNIPTLNKFKYLGIVIFPNLENTVENNYMECLDKIRTKLEKWMSKPISFGGRISIIKMMILPLINFLSSMLPLNPPKGYWDKLHSLISEFIWNRKPPRIKLETLQKEKSAGGWGLPNFKIYHWSFILWTIKAWLDPSNPTS